MVCDYPSWRDDAAQFLADNLPKAWDGLGWQDMALTAYQIGCMALVELGFADEADWGALPKDAPELPAIMPRWDDICISVLWLARQQRKLSYRLPDGSLPPRRVGNGFSIARKDPLPTPPPNIMARFGMGCALCDPDVLRILERLGLFSDGGWTKDAEFIMWRTSPESWSLQFRSDKRFLDAAQSALDTLPEDLAAEISKITEISDVHIDKLIASQSERVVEGREKPGPRALFGEAPSREQARRMIESSRSNALDWVFFRRWRIDDGWLSATQAKAALEVFHDRLAIAMRKSVLQRLYPQKPHFFQ